MNRGFLTIYILLGSGRIQIGWFQDAHEISIVAVEATGQGSGADFGGTFPRRMLISMEQFEQFGLSGISIEID